MSINEPLEPSERRAPPRGHSMSGLWPDQIFKLRQRWLGGQRWRAEEAAREHPGQPLPSDILLDLVYLEIELRRESGETPEAKEYQERFPELAEPIRYLFMVEGVLEDRDTSWSSSALENTHLSKPPVPLTEASKEPRSASLEKHAHDSAQAEEIPPMIAGYEILQEIARGGMGVVYKARHLKLQKLVALKVIRAGAIRDAEILRRFEREMVAVGKLEHPNIVRAMDAGEQNGLHYLVMEYVEGSDLAQLVRETGRFTIANACKVVRQAAQGLAVAHAAGLVHRDIKPSNMLLSKDGRVKLLDLGLARLGDVGEGEAGEGERELTSTGQAFGTPDFMAPEQWDDSHTADARSDLYALGCTLYYLLVGHAPYATKRSQSFFAKMKAHCLAEIPSLLTERPDAPPELAAVYMQLLQKDAAKRIQTASELVTRLEAFASSKAFEQAAGAPIAAVEVAPVEVATVAPGLTLAPLPERKEVTAKGSSKKRFWGPETTFGVLIAAGALAIAAYGFGAYFNRPSTVFPQGSLENASTRAGGETSPDKEAELETPAAVSKVWQGWPKNAPAAAMAPFDAAQAAAHQEAWAKYLGAPKEFINSLGMKFVLIPPGEFWMGSTPDEIQAAIEAGPDNFIKQFESEGPQHRVVLTKAFYLGVREVTQREYVEILGRNPSFFSPSGGGAKLVPDLETEKLPVDTVTFNDAAEFCQRLSEREKHPSPYLREGDFVEFRPGRGYRLPTEAEWEFACRAGTTSLFWSGNQREDLVRVGFLIQNSERRTRAEEVPANPFGLQNMHGNLWEWVQDGWAPNYYGQFATETAIDPQGSTNTEATRIIRGGGWDSSSSFHCRSASRFSFAPHSDRKYIGLRVALPVEAVVAGTK